MEWREEGLLLARRPHGESSAIIEVLTHDHGRHAGIVRGGASRKMTAVLQPGAQLDVTWRARLEDHLGSFAAEPVKSRATLMSDRKRLAGLNALTALLVYALPEREAHTVIYKNTLGVLDMMEGDFWPAAYLRWELSLLEELGYGLDLHRCAVTGTREGLTFVSPKSGRAVATSAAGEWADKLMPLSPALVGKSVELADVCDGLRVTGYFLRSWLAPALGQKPLPDARMRLVELLRRASNQS